MPDEFVGLDVVNVGYTGHPSQLDAGLIDMGGRLYDPHLGRMASADPFVVAPTSAQGWNRYAYVLNQPGSFTDPSGFLPAADADKGEVDTETPQDLGFAMTVPVTGQRTPQTGVAGSGSATDGLGSGGGGSSVGSSMPASQRPGDAGPSSAQQAMDEAMASAQRVGQSMRERKNPLLAFSDAMVRDENPSQERRRRMASEDAEARARDFMQNPPTYVVVSVEITMIFIGGDAEAVMGAVQGLRGVAGRRAMKELGEEGGETLVAGIVKRKGSKDGPRAGQKFTPGGKKNVRQANRDAHRGRLTCEDCGRQDLIDPPQTRGGRSRSPQEGQVDHIIPKSKGGDGAPSNGQVLCRDCNSRKLDRWP